jgi:hypothetical protein
MDGGRENGKGVGCFRNGLTQFHDAARQFRSTLGRQTGILADVDPGLRENM